MRRFVALQLFVAFILFGLHGFVPWVTQGKAYSPFDFARSGNVFDESHFYAPPAARFQRFGMLSGDFDVFENWEKRGIYPVGPSVFLGVLARAVGSLDGVWTVLHGLLPALLWLLVFLGVRNFSTDFWARSFLAWLFVVVAFGPRHGLLLSFDAFWEPPDVGRLPNPALTGLFFFSLVFFLSELFQGVPKRKAVAAGLLGGLLFQFYTFYALAWFAAVALLIVVGRIYGKRDAVKLLGIVMVAGLVVGLPSVVQTFLTDPELRQRMIERQSIMTHAPSAKGFIIFFASLVGCALSWKRGLKLPTALFAVMAGAGAGMNLQILTGADVYHWIHYRARVVQPCLVLLAGLSLVYLCRTKFPEDRARRYFIGGTGLLIALLLTRQILVTKNLSPRTEASQASFELMRWARAHDRQPKVYSTTDRELLTLIPAVTGQWTFVPSNYRTYAPQKEVLRRFAVAAKWEGKSAEETLALFRAPPFEPTRPWTGYSYVLLREPKATPALIAEVAQRFEDADLDLAYGQIDYVILDKVHPLPAWAAAMKPVYENRAWVVYPGKK